MGQSWVNHLSQRVSIPPAGQLPKFRHFLLLCGLCQEPGESFLLYPKIFLLRNVGYMLESLEHFWAGAIELWTMGIVWFPFQKATLLAHLSGVCGNSTACGAQNDIQRQLIGMPG